jgi:hypothetical protein
MERRAATTSILGALFISALGTSPVSAQAPQGPLPAQDTPPLTDRQKCLTQLDPAPKVETLGQGTQNPGEKLSILGGVDCPPRNVDRVMPITPPPGSQLPVGSPSRTPDSYPDLHPG